MTSPLRPTAPIAADVLLPADPGLALRLAQDLLQQPRMVNHHHGLWGYSGAAREGGFELTIQATGIGGPSAVAVLAGLVSHGAERLIRIGPCVAIAPGLGVGELVVVSEAIPTDGASRALGARGVVAADERLTAALRATEPIERRVALTGADVIGLGVADARAPQTPTDPEAIVADLETAPLFALGRRRGVAVAAVLVVAAPDGGEEELEPHLLSLGTLAAGALADVARERG